MAILNKLGSIARNVSGRTGNMLEVSKLNALIRSSEDDIEELKQQLGEYFYGKYAAGVILDGDATEICKKIQAAYTEIKANKAEINSIKAAAREAENEAAEEAEAKAQIKLQSKELYGEFVNAARSVSGSVTLCPMCGASVTDGSRFCGNCGTNLC